MASAEGGGEVEAVELIEAMLVDDGVPLKEAVELVEARPD
jgi:hypothetical protein